MINMNTLKNIAQFIDSLCFWKKRPTLEDWKAQQRAKGEPETALECALEYEGESQEEVDYEKVFKEWRAQDEENNDL